MRRFPIPTSTKAFGIMGAALVMLIAAVVVLLVINGRTAGNKADRAQSKGEQAQKNATRATRKATQAQLQSNRIVKCLLNSKGPKRAARCLNLTLPRPQPGVTGQAGQPGRQGERGPPGISVRGPRGSRGPRGVQGIPGPKGDPCLASLDPACIGETGAKGDTGEQGAKGDTGDKGEPGRPPTKAEIDAAVRDACPPNGDCHGPPGPAGADSTVPGPAGAQGPQGAQGVQGPAIQSFTFTDPTTGTVFVCSDPDGDLNYSCAPA